MRSHHCVASAALSAQAVDSGEEDLVAAGSAEGTKEGTGHRSRCGQFERVRDIDNRVLLAQDTDRSCFDASTLVRSGSMRLMGPCLACRSTPLFATSGSIVPEGGRRTVTPGDS